MVAAVGHRRRLDRAVHRDLALRLHHRRGGGRVVRGVLPGGRATFVTLAAIISFYFIFRGCFDIVMAFAGSAVSGWWVLLISGLIELGLGFWAAGSWNVSVVVLVAWVAAGALVHGIGEIALAFQIHQGRRGVTAVQGLADRLGVTNNNPAPDAAVPTR
jgi:hypothetical protein